jgi:hypothetical protein
MPTSGKIGLENWCISSAEGQHSTSRPTADRRTDSAATHATKRRCSPWSSTSSATSHPSKWPSCTSASTCASSSCPSLLSRSGPPATAVPIIAVPGSLITVLTSSKSTFTRPGIWMTSLMPPTAFFSTSLAYAKACSCVTPSPITSSSFLPGTTVRRSGELNGSRSLSVRAMVRGGQLSCGDRMRPATEGQTANRMAPKALTELLARVSTRPCGLCGSAAPR